MKSIEELRKKYNVPDPSEWNPSEEELGEWLDFLDRECPDTYTSPEMEAKIHKFFEQEGFKRRSPEEIRKIKSKFNGQ